MAGMAFGSKMISLYPPVTEWIRREEINLQEREELERGWWRDGLMACTERRTKGKRWEEGMGARYSTGGKWFLLKLFWAGGQVLNGRKIQRRAQALSERGRGLSPTVTVGDGKKGNGKKGNGLPNTSKINNDPIS
jgi:hypothetical protein